MYVWPYLARLPIKSLTPGAEGRVVPGRPGADHPGMLERGRYVFTRSGPGPDGARRYFISGERASGDRQGFSGLKALS